jgi:glycosyltransferase involved in cell wall biosynthesis
VVLRGEVANGPELWRLYRAGHVFLHVSLTEGLPQVLCEAQAAGVPIVATAVGGVAEALGGGAAGLLVPPRDAVSAAAAVQRIADEPSLRRRLVAAALAAAERETLEDQLDRVAQFLRTAATTTGRECAPSST